MSADFSDNNKINKHKFFENNIYKINGDLSYNWTLREKVPDYCYICSPYFNWENTLCGKCNKEYGCIKTNYNIDNRVKPDRYDPKYRYMKMPEFKSLQNFSENYCIGCFMTNHYPIRAQIKSNNNQYMLSNNTFKKGHKINVLCVIQN